MSEWNVPHYDYDDSTTLKQLLRDFFHLNNQRVEDFARELVVSVEKLREWIDGIWTTGLTTKYRQIFEERTGISLERLQVIAAKSEILADLQNLASVRERESVYARMLARDPELVRKIDFDQLVTRDEILDALTPLCEEMGSPLLAWQIGVEQRLIIKLVIERRWRPTGTDLKSCIIATTTNLVTGPPDEVRFRLLSEAIFGCPTEQVLGISSLARAIEMFFHDLPTAHSLVTKKTNVEPNTVARLRTWTPPGSGKMTHETMIKVLRYLLKRKLTEERSSRLDEYLQRFDRAATQCTMSDFTVSEPVFGANDPENDADEDLSLSAESADTYIMAQPIPELEPVILRPSGTEENSPMPISAAVQRPSVTETPSSEFLSLMLLNLLQQIMCIVRMDRHALSYVDWSCVGLSPLNAETVTQPPDLLTRLGDVPLTTIQEEAVLAHFEKMKCLTANLCKLSEPERTRVLKRLDDPLGQIASLLDAADSPEPRLFLETIGSPEAAHLAGRKP